MTRSDNMPAPLNAREIAAICQATGCDIDVRVLETVDSTNTWLLEGDFPSPVTLGVTFSLRFNCSESVAQFNGLSLLVGAVLCDCLRAVGIEGAMVKWPNDVLVNNAKLAGILIESRAAASEIGTCIVVGMGINYKRGDEAQFIDQASTDLSALCGSIGLPDRSTLIAEVAVSLVDIVTSNVPDAVRNLATRWNSYDALTGVEVSASVAGGESVVGIAHGIDASGGFQIKTAGGIRVFTSADVSVRQR